MTAVIFRFLNENLECDSTPMKPFSPQRRWVRQTVDLPVKIGIYQDSGLVTELSEGGMSLYAGMALKPGDLLEVEFEMPVARTVQAVVRNKTGLNFGLEFVERLH
jgi:hypothetical protein